MSQGSTARVQDHKAVQIVPLDFLLDQVHLHVFNAVWDNTQSQELVLTAKLENSALHREWPLAFLAQLDILLLGLQPFAHFAALSAHFPRLLQEHALQFRTFSAAHL